MTSFDDKTIAANQARMESERYGFDSLRGEIADLVLPMQGGFNTRHLSQGHVQTNAMFDEYAAQALQDAVSIFEGFVMPRGQKWQNIALGETAPAELDTVENKRWLESKRDLVFSMRNDPKSGFTSATHSCAESLMGFGEQSFWVDKRYDDFGRFAGFSYQSEHVAGVWADLDAEGRPMRVHRKFELTAEAATRKWGDKCPPAVRDAMDPLKKRAHEKFEFIHVIERNPRVVPGRIDAAGMPWRGCYYSPRDKDGDRVFATGGYRTLRRIVSYFARSHNESYGRGPAVQLLPTVRGMQVVSQDRVLAVEFNVKPPFLAPDDDLDEAIIALKPFGITYGGLDSMGHEQLKPLFGTSIDLNGAEGLVVDQRATVDRGFFRDLLQLNREYKTHISAARTLEEIGEKGLLLAPLARQEQEWFAPLLDAELDLLREEGFLDDMPPMLREYFASGGGIGTTFDNKLTQMQEAVEAAGYLRTAEQVASIATFDPGAVKLFQREYPLPRVLPALGRINGVPAKWQSTDDEKAAFDQQEQQQAQLAQILEAAPAIANAAKSAAQAGAIDGGTT
jgi:hypothetical protein